MSYINQILKAPSWTMEDAYGDLEAPRYEESVTHLTTLIDKLASFKEIDRNNLQIAMQIYEDIVTVKSSLEAFIKCTGAKNSNDERVTIQNSRINNLCGPLANLAEPLFLFIKSLDKKDSLWFEAPLSNWRFEFEQKSTHWLERLNSEDKAWYMEFERMCFLPLGERFKALQKGVDFTAVNSQGENERIRAAKLVSVIKGAPDPILRHSVFEGLNRSYSERGELYATLLSQLHGFRLAAFSKAKVTPLEVSLHQNRMSQEALFAMRETILSHIEEIRKAVTLRASYFGKEKLAVYDLMCPAPSKTGVPALIPYAQGIGTVKKALGGVSQELSDFIEMMVQNRWVDAVVSDNKIGGAFYSRFNEFKMPRVFSSYMGTITTILQQGHELGHAYHYWTMRDMPMIQTEFPMTLTEMASTFNEAIIREYLLKHAENEQAHFDILWQELRSAANFLLNTMVRMDFELAYFKEREKGTVDARRCVELMRSAWKLWYGNSTEGADDFLWAYKLHYYKTDQLIYNYPYTVGYLLSQGLIFEKNQRGETFMDFYKAMLRDTGRMTLDELVSTHFNADATKPEFWEQCLKAPLETIKCFPPISVNK